MKSNPKSFKSIFFLIAILVVSIACAQNRPVTHDPVVAKQGDTYYLFCTGPGITSFTSKDLKTLNLTGSKIEDRRFPTHS